jgi:hypothetical protein
MAAKKLPRLNRDESTPLPLDVTQEIDPALVEDMLRSGEATPLSLDVTQEIDPALVEDMLRSGEATLTQTDFDEITIELPEVRQPKP